MIPETKIEWPDELPWEPGTRRAPDAYDAGSDYANETWTLTGISKEFKLYTPIVLTSFGLPFDPVHLYWDEAKLPDNELPYAVESPVPLLTGPVAPFEHTIFACPNPHAPGLFKFLDRMSLRAGADVYESVRQQVDLVDWVMLHRMSVAPPKPPRVSIALYGLIGPACSFVWNPPKDVWRDRFTLVRRDRSPKGPNRERK